MISEIRRFAANIETVPEMMEFISKLAEDLPPKVAYDMTLACEELLVNIASYGYPDNEGELTILWDNDTDNRNLTVCFEDSGIPFNPLSLKEPNLKVPIEERKIGGLGIMMVRKLTDSVEYVYTDRKNKLTITKKY